MAKISFKNMNLDSRELIAKAEEYDEEVNEQRMYVGICAASAIAGVIGFTIGLIQDDENLEEFGFGVAAVAPGFIFAERAKRKKELANWYLAEARVASERENTLAMSFNKRVVQDAIDAAIAAEFHRRDADPLDVVQETEL